MRVLITGITGFVGSHLTEFALERGADVIGALRWRSKTEHIEHLRERVSLVECDLRDVLSVRGLLEQARPDYIIHLAAQSFVAASWNTPSETLWTNAICQMNLFEAMRQLGSSARFLVIGSSEEYGLVHADELPIRETNPLRPLSPYAVSKVTQDLMGWQYFKSYGMHIVRARAFNHTGPRRGETFATSNFAKQIAEMEAGLREPVVHVDLLREAPPPSRRSASRSSRWRSRSPRWRRGCGSRSCTSATSSRRAISPTSATSWAATGSCSSGARRARCTTSAPVSSGRSSAC